AVSKPVNPCSEQTLRVCQVEFVGENAHVLPMCLIDNCLIDFGLHFWIAAMVVVHPHLQVIGVVSRHLTDIGTGLVGSFWVITDVLGIRTAVCLGESSPGGKETCSFQLAGMLGVSELENNVFILAERRDCRHSIT